MKKNFTFVSETLVLLASPGKSEVVKSRFKLYC